MTILEELMAIKGVSSIELAKRTNLSKYEICRLRKNTRKGKISTIRKVAEALDMPPSLLTLRIKEERTNEKVQN